MHQIERLRHALSELENQLQDLDSLDPQTQAMLRRAAVDINAKLSRRQAEEATPTSQPAVEPVADSETEPETESLQGSLRERMVDFEASHPQLAMVLNRVIDLLGQAGI